MATDPGAQLPPAGWYDDPAGSGGTRWWDGQRWYRMGEVPASAVSLPVGDGRTGAVDEVGEAVDVVEASREDVAVQVPTPPPLPAHMVPATPQVGVVMPAYQAVQVPWPPNDIEVAAPAVAAPAVAAPAVAAPAVAAPVVTAPAVVSAAEVAAEAGPVPTGSVAGAGRNTAVVAVGMVMVVVAVCVAVAGVLWWPQAGAAVLGTDGQAPVVVPAGATRSFEVDEVGQWSVYTVVGDVEGDPGALRRSPVLDEVTLVGPRGGREQRLVVPELPHTLTSAGAGSGQWSVYDTEMATGRHTLSNTSGQEVVVAPSSLTALARGLDGQVVGAAGALAALVAAAVLALSGLVVVGVGVRAGARRGR